LCRGPYGVELLHQSWILYCSMHLVEQTDILFTCSHLFFIQKPRNEWFNSEGKSEFKRVLRDSNQEENAKGIFAFVGFILSDKSIELDYPMNEVNELTLEIEKFLLKCEEIYQLATVFALTILWSRHTFRNKTAQTSFEVLKYILSLRLSTTNVYLKEWCSIALSMHFNLPRDSWRWALNDAEISLIRESLGNKLVVQKKYIYYINLGDLLIAFHSGSTFTDIELFDMLTLLKKDKHSRYDIERIDGLLNQLEIKKISKKNKANNR